MFNYLLEKINSSNFLDEPFEHIYIENFFNNDDFSQIINSKQINLINFKNTQELYNCLLKNGYEPEPFPGCTVDISKYCKWEKGNSRNYQNVDTTAGFGMAFRLKIPTNGIIREIRDFINSEQLKKVLCKKFKIDFDDVFGDMGVQKYLNGYEISPHPDVQSKALTFMVNINPGKHSETENFHTHYMSFVDQKKYIYDFWKYNTQFDRCWVPWNWCNTVKQQNINNSIVIFKPSYQTLHAVKAKYNHLKFQRTQLYGNLWYKQGSKKYKWSGPKEPQIPWQGLVIDESRGDEHVMSNSQYPIIKVKNKIKKILKTFL